MWHKNAWVAYRQERKVGQNNTQTPARSCAWRRSAGLMDGIWLDRDARFRSCEGAMHRSRRPMTHSLDLKLTESVTMLLCEAQLKLDRWATCAQQRPLGSCLGLGWLDSRLEGMLPPKVSLENFLFVSGVKREFFCRYPALFVLAWMSFLQDNVWIFRCRWRSSPFPTRVLAGCGKDQANLVWAPLVCESFPGLHQQAFPSLSCVLTCQWLSTSWSPLILQWYEWYGEQSTTHCYPSHTHTVYTVSNHLILIHDMPQRQVCERLWWQNTWRCFAKLVHI